jgi:hypothetical protein
MRPAGTIGVVSTRGFAAGCIRLGTRSHYNHVIIAEGTGWAFEAEPGGVDTCTENAYKDAVWVSVPLTEGQRVKVLAYLHTELGTPYNWPAIVVFALRTLMPWLPHKALDGWADRRRNQICSELAVNALRWAGVDLFPGRLAATVSPADILNLALREGWA